MSKYLFPLLLIISYPISSQENLTTEDYLFIAFWEGTDPQMTLHQLASYCAPIFWYSPDEPELQNKEGKHTKVTDMNGDGYYTHRYDVNNSRNDAWGYRTFLRY